MLWLLLAVALTLAVAIAALTHIFFWRARFRHELPYAEVATVETSDGGAIELRRLEDHPSVPGSPPVLLVHGIAANFRNLDLDTEHSLARYLGAQGRDVWLVSLRSGLPRSASGGLRLQALIDIDLPLAVAEVQRRTGAERIDLVGFSLGAWLIVSGLGRSIPEASVARAVSIALPSASDNRFFRLQGLASRLPARALPLTTLGLLGVPWVHWLRSPLHRLFFNPKNMDSTTVNRALVNIVRDVESSLSSDLTSALSSSAEQAWLTEVHALTIPMLFIVGASDPICDVSRTEALFQAWGSDTACEKKLLVLGTTHGVDLDFGHADLVLGRLSQRYVFEPTHEFLA